VHSRESEMPRPKLIYAKYLQKEEKNNQYFFEKEKTILVILSFSFIKYFAYVSLGV